MAEDEIGGAEQALLSIAEAEDKLVSAASALDEEDFEGAKEQVQEAIEALQVAVKNL